jgi:hypothetical protein
MNTIGKILVILNFVFAIIVGILLVWNFGMQYKWRETYLQQQREMAVFKSSAETLSKSNISISNDNTKGNLKTRDQEQKFIKEKDDLLERLHARDINLEVLQQEYNKKLLVLQDSLSTQKRQVDENDLLRKQVKDREESNVKVNADKNKYRVMYLNGVERLAALQSQNEVLLERVRELERAFAIQVAGASAPGSNGIKINAPNPPAVKVQGEIVRVHEEDNTLVEISIGSDKGVNKNHTLDVYRMAPKAQYLGMIRILDSYHHKSVGRLVTTDSSAYRPQLKQGDTVASSITR